MKKILIGLLALTSISTFAELPRYGKCSVAVDGYAENKMYGIKISGRWASGDRWYRVSGARDALKSYANSGMCD